MANLRLFICINLKNELKSEICKILNNFTAHYGSIKWVKPENLHLTLKFLGDTPIEKIEKIKKTLTYIASINREFTMELSGLGVFPDLKTPRIIWLGIPKGRDNLVKLNNILEEELDKLGYSRENKEFKSHITIGRVKYFEKNLNNILQDIRIENLQTQQVKKIDLMKSTLQPKGPIYEILGEYHLGVS